MQRLFLTLFALLLLLACKEETVQTSDLNPGQESIQLDNSLQAKEKQLVTVAENLPDIDHLMGKFNPAVDSNFIRIDQAYTDKPVIFLQKEAYAQFIKMHDAAMESGLDLRILSAARPFDYQKNIWERKWTNLLARGMSDEKKMVVEILKYSAMPGTSRHHWGTDIDLNYLSNAHFESGNGKELYEWLKINAHEFGFCQPYTTKNAHRPNGYEEEKWHWSYMPLADKYFEAAKIKLNNQLITGFSGAKYADSLNVVEHYVLGVDPKCQ